MFQGSLRAGVAAFALAVGTVCTASPAFAQRDISLPSGSLQDSLNTLSRQSGAQILYDQTLLNGKKARAIKQAPSVEAALSRLLRGLGLTWRKRGDAFLIVRDPSGRPAPARRRTAVAAGRETEQVVAASGDIVVTGSRPIAESEESALQRKKASDSIIEVIASDALGQYSDQNVAAAVARLPGVATQRNQGQARYVSIRGAPNQWTTLAFGGVNVIGPAGRLGRFDTIPSALAGSIVVKKAVTPDMPGETLAGNIDIIPRSPFDYPQTKLLFDGAYGLNQLGQGQQYNVSAVASTRFANDTLGVLVTASRDSGDTVTDNFEITWKSIAGKGGEPARVWASKYTDQFYRVTRATASFSGRLEWKPDAANKIAFSSIYTEYSDRQLQKNIEFTLSDSASGYTDTVAGNTPMVGVETGVGLKGTYDYDHKLERIFSNTLNGEHEWDGWKLKWFANFSRANDITRPGFGSDWASSKTPTARPSITYDFSNPEVPKLGLFTTVANAEDSYSPGSSRPYISTSELALDGFKRAVEMQRTDGYTAKFDVDHDLRLFGADTRLRFGGEYDRRTKNSLNNNEYAAKAGDIADAGLTVPTQADLAIDLPYQGNRDLPYSFSYFSEEAGNALMDEYIRSGAATLDDDKPLNGNYWVREQIFAGYGMGTTSFAWGNIVYGARVEHVKNTGSAMSKGPDGFEPIITNSSDTFVFPSLHVNWNIDAEMKLRLSLNTGAARPEYSQMRPNFKFDDNKQTVSGGNPDLKPERSKGIDLYYEWYMPSAGFFSIGGYYKKLSKVLFDFTYPEFGSDILNSNGIDRSPYVYSTHLNGGSGSIKGIEISYRQPLAPLLNAIGLYGWTDGFGFEGNATFNKSKAETPDNREVPVEGASARLFNVSGFYEKYGLSARINYTYRSKYLDALGDAAGDKYWAANGRLDASVQYAINPRVKVYFEASNLTNESGIRFTGDFAHPTEHESFGRRFLWGMRTNF